MPAKITIKGGPDLRARLVSIPAGAPEIVAVWADDAASRMRAAAPNARRPESKKFTTKVAGLRAAVYGAFWWVFVDRGTKGHTISGSGGKNPPDTLRFQVAGRTIFSKKVTIPRRGRRPFITKSAQDAFANAGLSEIIIKLWNRKRSTSHKRFI